MALRIAVNESEGLERFRNAFPGQNFNAERFSRKTILAEVLFCTPQTVLPNRLNPLNT
jgi:hypothetical protein